VTLVACGNLRPYAIVVTGGATGIGRAVAERFVADGAEVVITGRRADVFPASPAARHITAQVLHVNGGALITR
jgi:3-oxoacyl-[acyl-carrier protein] reductase